MIKLYLIRHGETEWSKSGQHTGVTDLPLTSDGIKHAELLGKKLKKISFDHVFSSPLKRAKETSELCDLQAELTRALVEWNYGDYEGLTTPEIHAQNPEWNIFTHGGPNGESCADVQKRADDFLKQMRSLEGNIALFSSGHFSRALTARWLQLPIEKGRLFILSTASLSILSQEHGHPAIALWNET